MRAVVVGGGIGGLSAALALRAAGVEVEVLEREPTLAEAGAGLQLGPNALRPLFALGLEAALRRAGSAPAAAEIRRGSNGRRLHATPYAGAEARWGAPYLHVHRADLQAILLGAARAAGVDMRFGARVEAAAPSGEATLATGETVSADLVVGADGLRSPVALSLGGALPRSSGRTAWRALIDAARLPSTLLEPRTQVRIGRGRHLVTYPLRGGSALNLVAVTRGGGGDAASWTDDGDPQALRRAFGGWAEPVPTLLAALEGGPLWRGGLFERPPRGRWVQGRVALLGDAAHAMSPSFAQGAGMAIEDAVVLARAVSSLGVESGLAAYARERRPRTARVQAQSRRNGRLFHLPEAASTLLFRIAARMDAADPLARFDWLYAGGPLAAPR